MIYNWPISKEKFQEKWIIGNVRTPSKSYELNVNIKFKDLNNAIRNKFKVLGTSTIADDDDDDEWYYQGELYYDNELVYNMNWLDEAYSIITFLEPPTGDLLTWLQANATKQ